MNSLKSDIFYLVNGYKVNLEVDWIDDLNTRIRHIIDRHYDMMVSTNPSWYCCKQSHEKEMILKCCIETYVMEEIHPLVGVPGEFDPRSIR